jgi:hypothetical protein
VYGRPETEEEKAKRQAREKEEDRGLDKEQIC